MSDEAAIATIEIEILGKLYPVRCPESEILSLQAAADYLNDKMSAVQGSGKAINLERIAIMTALNMANELLQLDQEKNKLVHKINQRITHMQDKLDTAFNKSLQTELIYTAE